MIKLNYVLAVSGKPGLYQLVSNAKNMIIVEALDATKKRQPIYATDKVISLADIAMYTDEEEVPLKDVLESVKKKENGAIASIDPAKASKDELSAYFAEILPNYDRDRVYVTDIKKLIKWYNTLVEAGITEYVDAREELRQQYEEAQAQAEAAKDAEEAAEEKTAKKPAAKKTAKKDDDAEKPVKKTATKKSTAKKTTKKSEE